MKRVLVIEDNHDLAAGLESNLQLEGYQVQCCHNGGAALEDIEQFGPDLIILDMMLPEKDGFQILTEIRKTRNETPILCLTARGEEIDKVRALRSGADDYVTKPFGLMELLARVEAVLRRSSAPGDNTNLGFGEVTVCIESREVHLAGKEIVLAPKEFELLAALLANPNVVISRQQLMKTAWGHSAAIVSRTVDTHIAELRRKLEVDPANPRFILTVRKVGYRLVIG
jgi:two-component system alkaline phosphatase synthesis response regulator PhoP